MSRIFEGRCLWRLTPEAYRAATELLADAARKRLGTTPTVIGIAQGGRAPAYAISARLGAPIVIVTARHNASDAIGLPATGEVTCDLGALRLLSQHQALAGPFLVVDDICGSGSTLSVLTAALRPLITPDAVICTATLCRNDGAEPGQPDLHVWDVADWVVFPWEQSPAGRAVSALPRPTKVQES